LLAVQSIAHPTGRSDRGRQIEGLQIDEFAAKNHGYTATRHQHEVGTSSFDDVKSVVFGGDASTLTMQDSTENQQF
jgi:isocitrate lyase